MWSLPTAQNRMDDIARIMKDKAYLQELYREFSLWDSEHGGMLTAALSGEHCSPGGAVLFLSEEFCFQRTMKAVFIAKSGKYCKKFQGRFCHCRPNMPFGSCRNLLFWSGLTVSPACFWFRGCPMAIREGKRWNLLQLSHWYTVVSTGEHAHKGPLDHAHPE